MQAAALSGKFHYGVAFGEPEGLADKVENISATLVRHGFSYSGKDFITSGISGMSRAQQTLVKGEIAAPNNIYPESGLPSGDVLQRSILGTEHVAHILRAALSWTSASSGWSLSPPGICEALTVLLTERCPPLDVRPDSSSQHPTLLISCSAFCASHLPVRGIGSRSQGMGNSCYGSDVFLEWRP